MTTPEPLHLGQRVATLTHILVEVVSIDTSIPARPVYWVRAVDDSTGLLVGNPLPVMGPAPEVS